MFHKKGIMIFCFMIILFLVFTTSVNAGTVYVHPTEGDYQTIQAAVDGAVIGGYNTCRPGKL